MPQRQNVSLLKHIEDGFVYYENLEDYMTQGPEHWRDLAYYARNELTPSRNVAAKDFSSIGQKLKELGEIERRKEIRLIAKALGISPNELLNDSVEKFIRNFNEILIGKRNYDNLLKRIDDELKRSDSDSSYRARSPIITSYFATYFVNSFSDELLKVFKRLDFDADADYSKILRGKIEKAFNKAVDTAIDKMGSAKENQHGISADEEMWSDIKEFYKNNTDFVKQIRSFIRANAGIEDFAKDVENMYKEGKMTREVFYKKNLRKNEILNFYNEQKARTFGGRLAEFLFAAMSAIGGKIKDSAVLGQGTAIAKEDRVLVFSFKTSVNTSQVLNGIVSTHSNNENLKELRDKLAEESKKWSTLDDTFIIFTSDKTFTLGSGFKDLKDGGSQKLSAAADVLDQVGIGNAEDFIGTMYSTLRGAMIADKHEELEEELRRALISAMLYLFFDDWETLGKDTGGATVIHTFNLNGILYPLSALLIAAGTAIERTANDVSSINNNIIRIGFSDPGDIKFHDKAVSFEEAYARFQEQRKIAYDSYTFHVTFLANVKDILRNLINN